MKKLFSIVLVAAGMLMSANAGVVTDPAQLQAALNAGGTVQLGGSAEDFVIPTTLTLEIKGEATLDLNGHNLVYAYDPETKKGVGDNSNYQGRMINLKQGTLNVINSLPASGGSILNNTDTYDRLASTGAADKDKSYAFGYYANATATKLSKGTEIVVFSVTGSADKAAENYSVLNISSEVTVSTPQGKVGIIINAADANAKLPYASYQYVAKSTSTGFSTTKLTYGYSFGVVLNVSGRVHGEKYGVQVSGNISVAPGLGLGYDCTNVPTGVSFEDAKTAAAEKGYDKYICNWTWDAAFEALKEKTFTQENSHFPIVNINSTADVSANPTVTANGNGFYAGGYAIVTIKGYVHGSNGAYIKAGDITIEDAVIKSENPVYVEITGKDREGSGNAITIESNKSYPGETTIVIKGDSKIESTAGYAIEETVTNSIASTTEIVQIEGGSFKGGEQGGVIFDEKTVNVEVEDGNFSNPDVNKYMSGDNYIILNDDGTVVVNHVEPGESKPVFVEDQEISGQEALTWNTAKEQNITTADANVGYFNMQKGTVNVKANATLTVNRLVMGTGARIVVEVGGRLIVDGDMGIVANQAENITIQVQENNEGVGMGQFLFNPAVNSNRHPMATVVFNSKAFNKTELVQFFACPMIARGVESITSSNNAYQSVFQIWNGKKWILVGSIGSVVNIDYSKFDTPFAICNVMGTNPSTDLLSYTFKGQLLGNTQPEGFKIHKGWAQAGNSWTGDANPTAMIAELASLGCNPVVYTYEQSGNTIVWNGHDQDLDVIDKVEPMQPLLFHNESGSTITHDIMNYENLVWNFRNGVDAAPARNLDITKAAIRIAAANGVADRVVVAEADKNSIEKYPNEAIRVYASADKEYDIFAAANLQNTYVGFNCVEAGTYTVSFNGVQGDNLVLVDLVNNREIAIVEGAEYQFEAKANTVNPAHFQVRKVAEVATNVENAAVQNDVIKTIVNDQVVIIRNGVRYNTVGQRL